MTGDRHSEWKLDKKWWARISGEACELCTLIEANRLASTEGYKVADMRVSRWVLGRNQHIRGYSIVILKTHAIELFELDSEIRRDFTEDITDASHAIYETLAPIKINLEMQGNIVPHLHCHIKPRFPADRPGHARIYQNAGQVVLCEEDARSMVGDLRRSLARFGC